MKFTLLLTITVTLLAALAHAKVVELEARDADGDPLLHDDESHLWGINFDEIPHYETEDDHPKTSDALVPMSETMTPRQAKRELSATWTRAQCIGPNGVAETWVAHRVMYCQCTASGTRQFVTSGPGPYRTDCSGFVSACWNVPPPGAVTWTLQTVHVAPQNMVRGDAFLRRSQHVALFWGWSNGNALVVEESQTGQPAKHATWGPSYWKTYETVRRPGWDGSGGSSSPNPPPAPAPHPPSPSGIKVGSTVVVTADSLNCRATPYGRIVTSVSHNQRFTVTEGPKANGGYTWWKLSKGCWAAGSYLKLASGNAAPHPAPRPAPRPAPQPPSGRPGTCGGNCPGGRCPSCPCGTSRQSVDIAAICRRWNGWSQSCCQCIVRHESGGNAHAMNYNGNGSFDVGVFQINQVNWPSCNGGKAPCDVDSNLNCAKRIYSGRHSFGAWSTARTCGC